MKKAITATKLLDSAQQALIEGEGHMEMSSVAKRANTSVGLAYHHFGSKSGLLSAVVDRFYAPISQIMMGDKIPVNQAWYDREKARTKAFVDYFYNHPIAPLVCGRLSRTPEVIDIEHAHFTTWMEEGAKNISQGQRQGVVSARLVPLTTISMLIGGLHASVGQAIQNNSKISQADLFDQLWELTCNLLQLEPEDHRNNGDNK